MKAEWDKWREDTTTYAEGRHRRPSAAMKAAIGPAEASLSQPGQPAFAAEKFQGELVSKDVTLNAEVKTPDGQTSQKTLVVTIQRVEGTLDGAQRDGPANHHADPGRLTSAWPSVPSCQLHSSKGAMLGFDQPLELATDTDTDANSLTPAPVSRISLAASSSHRREPHHELHVVVQLFDAEDRSDAELTVPHLAARPDQSAWHGLVLVRVVERVVPRALRRAATAGSRP